MNDIHPPSRPKRRIAAIAGLCLGALMATSAPELAPASASSGDAGQVSAATIRTCPDTRCGVVADRVTGPLPTWCWRDAGSWNGTSRWFRVTANGRKGWVSASQMPVQPTVPYCFDLLAGETLFTGQYVYSPNGRYFLALQGDGNLVLYGPSGPLWATMTGGGDNRFRVQGDGNIVVYNSSETSALWAAMTMQFANPSLVVQDDGNLVLYTSSGAIWASSWHVSPRGASRASNGFDAQNCTWYAADQWMRHWPQHRYPGWSGNAYQWAAAARAAGWQVYGQPMSQSVVVFPATSQSSNGHVAWVDALEQRADGQYIHVSEMNRDNLLTGTVTARWVKHVPSLQYIPAPDF